MKSINLVLLLSFCFIKQFAQKQSIDTEVLSSIIIAKQQEVEKKVISDIIYKTGKKKGIFINTATYNTFYYAIEALTAGKNKPAITEALIKELSLYVVANALTELFYLYNSNHVGGAPIAQEAIKAPYTKLSLLSDNSANNLNTNGYDIESSSRVLGSNSISIQERSHILDTIYYTVFNKFKSQGNFDLVSNREIIRSDFNSDLDYVPLSASIRANFGNFSALLSNFFNSLLPSGSTILGLDSLSKNFKINLTNPTTHLFADPIVTHLTGAAVFDVAAPFSTAFTSPSRNIQKLLPMLAILADFKQLTNLQTITPAHVHVLKQSLREIMSYYKSYKDLRAITDVAEIIIDNIEVVNRNAASTEGTIPLQFKINVEDIILGLEDKFYNNRTVMKNTILWGLCGIKPDISIGLNYLYFGNKTSGQAEFTQQLFKNSQINYVGLASEKFGVKFMFFDRRYTHSFGPGEWFQYRGTKSYRKWLEPVTKNPIITNGYVNAYLSGILYNIVDLKTNKEFNYGIFGTGGGITLFNNLDVNVGIGWVMTKSFMELNSNALFYSVSFDIPIFEYIKAIKK